MNNISKISLVGAGNVAYHLGRALQVAGLQILEVHTRKESAAKELIRTLGTSIAYQKDLDFRKSKADMIMLCVSDDAIITIAEKLKITSGVTIVHASGAVDISALQARPTRHSCGVLYPFQTFSKQREVDFSAVPVLIEASDYSTRSRLLALAHQISHHVRYITSDERRRIHLAGVFANNFTNHLLKLSFDQLAKLDIDKALVRPLVMETLFKAFEDGPESSQTGPARRGDEKSLAAHVQLLADDPNSQALYKLISDQIKSHFAK
jgi:predicted short-subunit dehydrogenase-like oxidoreductase (DUF2520 family)